MLNKVLKIIGIIAIAIVALSASYYFLQSANDNVKSDKKVPSKEEDIRAQYKLYSDMIDVELCREAYDEFISFGSKERKGFDNFLAHCKYRAKDWNNFQISNIVFSNNERADIKYSYDLSLPDLDSIKYHDCLDRNSDGNGLPSLSSWQFCRDIAPKKIEARETVETWLMEEGKWKRDY